MQSPTTKLFLSQLPDPCLRAVEASQVDALYERVPLQTALNRLINLYSSASEEARTGLEADMRAGLRALEEADGDGHSNPLWLLPTMRACIEGVLGHFERALAHTVEALERAEADWQRAISYGNASEALRFMGDHDRAIDAALRAVRLDPRHEGFWSDLILALLGARRFEDVGAAIRAARDFFDPVLETSVFGQALSTYPLYRQCRGSVPELDALLDAILVSREVN